LKELEEERRRKQIMREGEEVKGAGNNNVLDKDD
jgi:hypothetical protein